jgi:hypothetical protein
MISMDDSLLELYRRGVITKDTLFEYCSDRHEVESLLGDTGKKSKQPA